MYIRVYGGSHEIYLGYRPLAVSFLDPSQAGEVNIIRIFIINLNSSESLLFTGEFRLRIGCLNVTTQTRTYAISESVSRAAVRATVDGDEGIIHLPLTPGDNVTSVRLEILICNVRMEEVNF